MLHRVAEVKDLHATNNLSMLAKIILDIEFVEIVSELDNGTCARSHLGNSSFGSHSPRFSGSDNDVVRISKSSIGANFQCLNVGIILTR